MGSDISPDARPAVGQDPRAISPSSRSRSRSTRAVSSTTGRPAPTSCRLLAPGRRRSFLAGARAHEADPHTRLRDRQHHRAVNHPARVAERIAVMITYPRARRFGTGRLVERRVGRLAFRRAETNPMWREALEQNPPHVARATYSFEAILPHARRSPCRRLLASRTSPCGSLPAEHLVEGVSSESLLCCKFGLRGIAENGRAYKDGISAEEPWARTDQ